MKAYRYRFPLLLVILLLVSASIAADQETASSWIRYFEGADYGALFDAALMADGSILAVGATHYAQGETSHGDILLLNVDLDGEPIWETSVGGGDLDQAICVEPFQQGFLVLGETDSFGAGKRDLYLLKISQRGQVLWARTYGGEGAEWAKGLLVREDGTIVLVGGSDSFGGGDVDAYIVAVDGNGLELWSTTLGDSTTQENATAVLGTSDGGLVILSVISYPSGYSGSHRDSRIQRLDPEGNEVWSRLLSGEFRMAGNAMIHTDDGDIIVAGMAEAFGPYPGPTDFWVARIDAETGATQWSIQVGNASYDDYGLALVELSEGGLLASGMGPGLPLMGFDEQNESAWVRTLTDLRVHGGFSILRLPDGSYIIPGLVFCGHSTDAFDAVLVRVTANGTIE